MGFFLFIIKVKIKITHKMSFRLNCNPTSGGLWVFINHKNKY